MTQNSIALLVVLCITGSCCPEAGWQAVRVKHPKRFAGLPDKASSLLALADSLLHGSRQPRHIDRAMAALQKALILGKRNHHRHLKFEANWRLARATFLLTETLPARDQRLGFARRGTIYGREAVAARADRVEGHYYLAANLGKLAETTGDLTLLKPAMAAAKRAARIDECYDRAGPLLYLGKVYLSAPPWPVSIGNPEKAIEVLQRALKIAPRPLTRVFLGQAYYEDEQYNRAELQLRKALRERHRLAPRWRREAEQTMRRIRDESAAPRPQLGLTESRIQLSQYLVVERACECTPRFGVNTEKPRFFRRGAFVKGPKVTAEQTMRQIRDESAAPKPQLGLNWQKVFENLPMELAS